jgi:hypothetical protein
MNDDRRNPWKAHTGHDTLLNGGLIAAGIVGLLLALIDGPAPEASVAAQPVMVSALVVAEGGAP